MLNLFITILLSFNSSLATKFLFLNDETCMVRPSLIDLNPVDLKYYPFMISLITFNGSCNVLSPKKCVPKETKGINVKVFNLITNENIAKAMRDHNSRDCKCKFSSTIVIQIKNGIIKQVNNKCKNYCSWKKGYSWNPSACICENSKYLKSITNTFSE